MKAAEDAGLSGVHFHDLRHAGNALTAGAGASLREPMERMGHASARARRAGPRQGQSPARSRRIPLSALESYVATLMHDGSAE